MMHLRVILATLITLASVAPSNGFLGAPLALSSGVYGLGRNFQVGRAGGSKVAAVSMQVRQKCTSISGVSVHIPRKRLGLAPCCLEGLITSFALMNMLYRHSGSNGD